MYSSRSSIYVVSFCAYPKLSFMQTTYEVCNIEKNVLMKFAWSYLIIDEAHRLKNEASEFSRTVRMFETRYRILITGYDSR